MDPGRSNDDAADDELPLDDLHLDEPGVWTDEAADEVAVGGGRSLLAASAAPAVGTMLSRLTGLVRVGALTAALGLTSLADVYNLSNTTPNILYELVLGGVLSATLVPLFTQTDADGDEDTASVLVTVGFVAICALTLLAVLASPAINWLLALPLQGAERRRELAIGDDLLALLLPQILFYGVTTLATAMLSARRRFAAPAFAPVLTNLVTAAAALGVYFFVGTSGSVDTTRSSLWALGLGTTAGVAAMAAALVPALRRADVRLTWQFRPRHPVVGQVARLSGWTVGFAMSNQVALLIVLTLARRIGTGALSTYQYAAIFFQLPYGLIAVSLMTAVLPELATAAKMASWSGVRVVIARADRPDVLADAVAGVPGVGTSVRPRAGRLSARKLWIGFALPVEGRVVVDDGAAGALAQGGRSLLAAGVTGVDGTFAAESAVEIVDSSGRVVAKGLVRTDSATVAAHAGRRSEDLPAGQGEIVHVDDLVVLP